MIISVPRERKDLETRVALTPAGVTALRSEGHTVLIETEAGLKCGILDAEYQAVGAEIVSSLNQVWERAELLVKVKEPAPEEMPFFRSISVILLDSRRWSTHQPNETATITVPSSRSRMETFIGYVPG